MKQNMYLSERNEKVSSVLDMLEQEFQVLTAIETGKILGGSGGVGTACPFTSVSPVISSNNFVGYNGDECYDLSQDQMAVASCSAAGYQDSGNYTIFSQDVYGNSHTYTDAAAAGADYINCELQEGNPVMVGVNVGNYGPPQPDGSGEANANLAGDGTDHFITIVGCGIDDQGRQYYQFYDSSTSDSADGASSNNRLYYNPDDGTMIGHSESGYEDGTLNGSYQVTSIRRTIEY